MARVGQADTEAAAQAAGTAAKTQAQKSSWPPTERDLKAIGAAAGVAACAALGAGAASPLCGLIGSEVGSAVFQLGDAIAGGLDPNRNRLGEYIDALHRTAAYLDETLGLLQDACGTSRQTEVAALLRRGALMVTSDGKLSGELRRGHPDAFARLESAQRSIFEAYSARAAECETRRAVRKAPVLRSPGSRVRGGTVLLAGGGLLLWLLAKLL